MVRPGGDGYRLDPAGLRTVMARVEGTPIERYAVGNALADALAAIGNVDDVDTDAVIYALSGIAADLHDAPARLDARVEQVVAAADRVLRTVEDGDDEMGRQVTSAAAILQGHGRFGGRP